MDEILIPRHLFGGAMDLSLPARFVDVSDFRPVPDNQEVFTDANLDQSLIVEFVDHHSVGNEEAGEFFWNDLTTAMDATQQKITSLITLRSDWVPHLPERAFATLVEGQVSVSKGRQGVTALNKVHLLLLVVRLPLHKTDMLVTLNTPVFISEHSAAAEHAGSGYKQEHLGAPSLFRQVLETLRIVDWNLFGRA